MQRLIVGLIALALVGAGATVWLVNSYIDRRVEDTAKKVETTLSTRVVLIAKVDIPTGKKIDGNDLDWLSWPDKGVQANFLSANQPDPKLVAKMVGTVARRGIIKGTPLTEAAVFRSATPGFLAGALDPNMRAVSVSITAETGASGFILPGDRVDVILMQDVNRNLAGKAAEEQGGFRPYLRFTAETVIQNLRVLAVDQKVNDFEKKAQVSKTVTVEVTQKQAEALAVVRAMGKIGLALRSFQDEKPVALSERMSGGEAGSKMGSDVPAIAGIAPASGDPSENVNKMVTNGEPTVTTDLEISPVLAASVASASGPAKGPKPAAVSPRPQTSARSSIRIYRGGQPSTVNF